MNKYGNCDNYMSLMGEKLLQFPMAHIHQTGLLQIVTLEMKRGLLLITKETTILKYDNKLIQLFHNLFVDAAAKATWWVAWPSSAIIYIDIILLTLGAALRSLTGALRLLAAIANDDILPVLNYFTGANGGEPHIAMFFTTFLCIARVMIGNLDLISPTIIMFYLLCYAGVNLSCFLLDLLDAPSWCPRQISKRRNWSCWLTDLFGSPISFDLLTALSELVTLPKDMLLSNTVQKEVCPIIGLSVIKRILDTFVPDKFCPDVIPEVVLELNSKVMAAPVISISSYSSKETVGSHVPRVILFGTIPTSIPVVHAEVPNAPADPLVAPEVGVVSVISPTRVLDLVDYSSSSDTLEDSLPVALELPLVSLFLCIDDSEADSESEPAEQRPERHESLAPSSESPLAPVDASPGIRQRPAILVRPSEAIPFGRPYRTHPNGPRKLLTARKRVGPFPTRRLAWSHVSRHSLDRHSSPDFTSDSSFSGSSSDSSSDISSGLSLDSYSDSLSFHSSGCDALSQSHSRSAPLSTLYPPTTSESSLDSSSERSIAPALTDLPPHNKFRNSYSFEVSGEEHMEIGTADVETVTDLGISDGVGAPTEDGIGMGVEVATSVIREDEEEFEVEASAGGMMEIAVDPLVTGGIFEPIRGDAPDLESTLYDIAHYMYEVPLNRITEFETAQR
ncbi:reverse transcriptase domain-containing protein [Tanacetum coccineum]